MIGRYTDRMADHFKAGQTVIVKINGIPQEARIRAVISRTDGDHLQVDFGKDQTALVSVKDVVEE
jgi:molybdopterin-binding protein